MIHFLVGSKSITLGYFEQAEDHIALFPLQSVRMLLASLAVLLAVLCSAQVQEPSLNNNKSVSGHNDERWNSL